MPNEMSFDVVIIGAGPGGYTAAIRAAQLGFSTAVIEKRSTMGGTCLNVGCIPSKALLDSSDHYAYAVGGLERHGVVTRGVQLDLARMMARKSQVVATLTGGVGALLKHNRVTVIHGTARCTQAHEVLVLAGETETRVHALRGVILAPGSAPAPLPVLPVDDEVIVDSTGALSFPTVPPRLAVVGGGAIGLELASVWSRLGSQVTIIELMPQILPGWDPQIARLMQRLLAKQGISVMTSTSVAAADRKNGQVAISLSGGAGATEIVADRVLVAVGRRPFVDGLGLEAIGVASDEKTGRVLVDKKFMTSCPDVYAIGDIVAGPMLAHKATAEGIAAAEIIAGKAGQVNYGAIPAVVYTNPEVAAVGSSEDALTAGNIRFSSGISFFKANGRALAMDRTEGFVKILSDAGTDRLLGVQIVGPQASDVIGQAVAVMELGGSAEDIGLMAHAHPTLTEVMKEAALDVDKRSGVME